MGGVITLPKSKVINLENDYDENPIKSDYTKGYEYSDLFVDDASIINK